MLLLFEKVSIYLQTVPEAAQRVSHDLDAGISIAKHWPIYENVLPDVTQELAFQSIIQDDSSVDFGQYFPTCQADFLVESAPVEEFPPKVDPLETKIKVSHSRASSPSQFCRSRPVSPNPTELNGSDKKRKKCEKEEQKKDMTVACVKRCFDGFESPQVLSRRPSGSSPPILIASPLLPNSSSMLEPDWTTGDLPMSNHHIIISTLSPDHHERLPSIVECQVMPSSQVYVHHCRSLSTSPEFRDVVFERKESRINEVALKEGKGEKVPRHKRPSHINAEHRRRYKIQVKYLLELRRYLSFQFLPF